MDAPPTTLDNPLINPTAEAEALVLISITTAAISLVCCILVLVFHSFMLWYRPATVNRVSLRLILLSAACNVLFTILKILLTKLSDLTLACDVLSYFMIASDVIASACLAMISLNLVLIFIVQVGHPQALEKYYYIAILLMGLLAAVVPLAVNRKGAKGIGYVCWYQYYYIDHATLKFKWLERKMWYYGWLLFTALVAIVCAALALIEFKRNQNFFAHSLDMGPPAEGSLEAGQRARTSQTRNLRGNQESTVIFRKVVIRCVIYATVPFIANIWGVCLQIATMTKDDIQYPVFVLDTLFDNLFGFMMSCIYFTDPTIKSIIRDIARNIKRQYVDEYYILQLDPDSCDTSKSALQSRRFWISERSGNPSIVQRIEPAANKISAETRQVSVSILSSRSSLRPGGSPQKRQTELPASRSVEIISPQLSLEARPPRRFTYPNINLRQQGGSLESSDRHPCHVQSAGAVEGKRRLSSLARPWKWLPGNINPSWQNSCGIRRSKPMHLIRDPKGIYGNSHSDYYQLGGNLREDTTGEIGSTEQSNGQNGRQRLEMIEPYQHPRFAMFMNWLFRTVFRIPPEKPEVHVVIMGQEVARRRQQEGLSPRAASPETSVATSSNLFLPSIDTSAGGTPAEEEIPMTWDIQRAKENKLLLDIDEEGFAERQRPLARRKMKDDILLSVAEQKPFQPNKQAEESGNSSAASSLAGRGQMFWQTNGSGTFMVKVTDSDNSSSRHTKDQQATETIDSSGQILPPQPSDEPRRPSKQSKNLQPVRQSREEKRTIFNVLSLRTPPVLQRRPSRRHLYESKGELLPGSEIPAIKLGSRDSESYISGEGQAGPYTPSLDVTSSQTSTSNYSPERSSRPYAVSLAPRPRTNKTLLAVQHTTMPKVTAEKSGRPVERPPSLLAVDVGLLRSDDRYIDPHSVNRITQKDIDNARRAFEHNAGFQYACTRLTFITSWETGDGRPRIYNFEETWRIDDIIENQIVRAAAATSYSNEDL